MLLLLYHHGLYFHTNNTLYTNLPLQTIFDNLVILIINRMFKNAGCHFINVNTYRQSYFWSNTDKSGYVCYVIDKTWQILHVLLFNSYVQSYLTTYSLWSAMHELSLLLNYEVYK